MYAYTSWLSGKKKKPLASFQNDDLLFVKLRLLS